MSAPYPESYVSYSPTNNAGPRDARKRGQVLGSMVQNSGTLSAQQVPNMRNIGTQGPSSQMSLNNGIHKSAGGPVLPLSPGHEMSIKRQTSKSPGGNVALSQSPNLNVHNRQPSSTSNQAQHKSNSFDTLGQENAQLRLELENLRIAKEDTQTACDDMLTALITTQESLQESQTANAEKEKELTSLRQQLEVRAAESRGAYPDALRPGPQGDDKDLKELRLKCGRLMKEGERREEHLRQARTDLAEVRNDLMVARKEAFEATSRPTSWVSQEELTEARNIATQEHRRAETLQSQVALYIKQLHEWNEAYDTLQATNADLKKDNAELFQAAQAAQNAEPKIDQQAMQAMQGTHATEMKEARRVSDFFKSNSEQLSRKNKTITDHIKNLQDSLNTKDQEIQQQQSMIEALRMQMR